MKMFKKLNESGDTIIEVLIVLAMLSFSFGISYATASKGLDESFNAEQHSEALGLLDTQVEEFRDSVASGYFNVGSGYFCMTGPSTTATLSNIPPNPKLDNFQEYTGCTFQHSPMPTKYYVSAEAATPATPTGTTYSNEYTTPVPCGGANCTDNSYTFIVRWEGTGSLGIQQESLTYRIGSNVLGAGGYQSAQAGGGSPLPVSSFLYGDQFSGCYNGSNSAWYCDTSANPAAISSCFGTNYSYGNDVVAYQASNTGPYNFITSYNFNIASSSDSNYNLKLNYTNFPWGCSNSLGFFYSYSVNVYINGGSTPGSLGTFVTTAHLTSPGNLTPDSINIPLNSLSSPPSSITLEWTNDFYGPFWDQNFDIQSVTLSDN